MTRTEQIIKTGTLIGTLVLTLGLSGCFTAEEPTPFKCSDKKLGCPPGYKCDPIKGECVDEKTKLDGRWVKIKAGTFKMGSPDGIGTLSAEPCRATNETEHQVTLTNDFEI